MTDHDDDRAEWHADRRDTLLTTLLAARPPAFAVPGTLRGELTQWASRLAAGTGVNLILTGPAGCGKTWSLWHAAEHAIRAGFTGDVTVATAAQFHRIVAPATASPATFTDWASAGLLILDDIGAFRLSEWDLDHLGELADIRSAYLRPTAIASNETDLRKLLGPRIASRLAQHAVLTEWDGDAPDLRRQ